MSKKNIGMPEHRWLDVIERQWRLEREEKAKETLKKHQNEDANHLDGNGENALFRALRKQPIKFEEVKAALVLCPPNHMNTDGMTAMDLLPKQPTGTDAEKEATLRIMKLLAEKNAKRSLDLMDENAKIKQEIEHMFKPTIPPLPPKPRPMWPPEDEHWPRGQWPRQNWPRADFKRYFKDKYGLDVTAPLICPQKSMNFTSVALLRKGAEK